MAFSRAALRPMAGFGLVLVLAVALGILANLVVRRIRAAEQLVSGAVMAEVIAAERLSAAVEGRAAAGTAFALTGDEAFLESLGHVREEFDDAMQRLNEVVVDPERRRTMAEIQALDTRLREESEPWEAMVEGGREQDARRWYMTRLAPLRQALVERVHELRRTARERANEARGAFTAEVSSLSTLLALSTVGALLLAAATTLVIGFQASRYERRLREVADEATGNEAALTALLSASPDLIFQVDRDHRIRFASLSSLRATGQTSAALRGVRLPDLELLDKNKEPFARALDQVLAEGRTQRLEGWCRANWGPLYMEFVLSPIYEGGRVESVVVTGRDLTERLQIEADLRDSNTRVVTVLESITDAFVSLDTEWRFTYVNREAERLFGIPRDALEGRSMWEAFPQTVGSDLEREYRAAMGRQQPVDLEEFFEPLGKWLEIHAYPSALGLSVYFRDVTQRKRAELGDKLLAEAGAHLSESLDYEATLDRMVAMPVPALADVSALWLKEDGGFRFVAHDVDPERQALLYRVNQEFPIDPSATRGLGRVIRTGESLLEHVNIDLLQQVASSVRHLRAMRELELTSLIAVPIRGRDEVVGILGIASRNTQRPLDELDMRIMEQLAIRAALAIDNARLYREAMDAARAREDLLAVVSHDLRNPLHQILLTAQTLLRTRAQSLDEVTLKKVEAIARASERMKTLISDLLDLAAAQANKLSLQRGVWPTERLVEEARESFEPLASERQVAFVVHNRAEGRSMDCDRARLLQVLSNLVGNALRFSPAHSTVTLVVEPVEGYKRIRFSVRDEGPGIAEELMPHLFERFWSGGAAAKGGTGLGLFIVKSIVESHGGAVWAQSEPGHGATFHVELPEAEEKELQPAPAH